MDGRALRRRRSLGASSAWISVAAVLLAVTPAAATGQPAPKIVSLTFDDGRVSQGIADGLLALHRMHGTFYIITQAVNAGGAHPESLTWGQIHRLARDGNEIAAHTRTHPDLPTLSATAQSEEICGSRRDLARQGFRAVSFAYPYGDYDVATEHVVQHCGFANGRGAWGGPETNPPADRYGLRTLANVTDAGGAADLEAQITNAAPGRWIQCVFHDIGDTYPGGDQYRMRMAAFSAFLDWLGRQRQAGTVVIKTIGGALH
jgi:peptidoglycan/xylan/chitin deacetylase (PgdA/CDA1 family)